LWQWIRHPDAKLQDGRNIDASNYRSTRSHVLEGLTEKVKGDEKRNLQTAAQLLDNLVLKDDFAAFLTLEAYNQLA
jgi:malate synthase